MTNEVLESLRVCAAEGPCTKCHEGIGKKCIANLTRKAADAIENLQQMLRASEEARSDLARQLAAARKELAEVKEERSWIGIKDRLPDATVCVLVHYDDGNMLVDAIGSDGEWMGEDFSCGNITHWMPLPEPPEEEIIHEKTDD